MRGDSIFSSDVKGVGEVWSQPSQVHVGGIGCCVH